MQFTGTKINGIYRFDLEEQSKPMDIAWLSAETTHNLCHRRLGYLSKRATNELRDVMATGLSFATPKNIPQCIDACLEGKQHREPFNNTGVFQRGKEKLDLIHSDVYGSMSKTGLAGERYLLTFVDDYTRKCFGFLIKTKDEVPSKFMEFMTRVEWETGKRIKVLRTDNGREYVNRKLNDILKTKGIQHVTTLRYTPEQNGIAEWQNRTIIEKARNMLQDAKLDRRLWGEAVRTAIYLKNRTPTKAVKSMTPEEAWTGKKIGLAHLRVFGCKAYAHVPKELRKKFDPKSKPHIMLGYNEGVQLIGCMAQDRTKS